MTSASYLNCTACHFWWYETQTLGVFCMKCSTDSELVSKVDFDCKVCWIHVFCLDLRFMSNTQTSRPVCCYSHFVGWANQRKENQRKETQRNQFIKNYFVKCNSLRYWVNIVFELHEHFGHQSVIWELHTIKCFNATSFSSNMKFLNNWFETFPDSLCKFLAPKCGFQ